MMYTTYREDPRPKPDSLKPGDIDSNCEFMLPGKKKSGIYERQFAEMWVHRYPEIDLYTQVRLTDETSHKADFMHWPTKTIIEIDGGTFMRAGHGGKHGSGGNYRKDGIAAYMGYAVFRLTSQTVKEMYKKQNFEQLEIIAETIRRRS